MSLSEYRALTKSIKIHTSCQYLFALLGPSRATAAHKMLMKSTKDRYKHDFNLDFFLLLRRSARIGSGNLRTNIPETDSQRPQSTSRVTSFSSNYFSSFLCHGPGLAIHNSRQATWSCNVVHHHCEWNPCLPCFRMVEKETKIFHENWSILSCLRTKTFWCIAGNFRTGIINEKWIMVENCNKIFIKTTQYKILILK